MRLALVLGGIALVISALLALVNSVTAPIIAENEVAARRELFSALFPQAQDFVELPEDPTNALLREGYRVAGEGGEPLGFAVIVVPRGYGGTMELAVGFDLEARVLGIDFLSMAETPGIGTQIEEESYRAQYVGLDRFDTVQAISGATVSSTAVREGAQAAAEAVQTWLADESAA